jgi:DNA-binding winged helix-turn-helix (wHTH) protein
LRFLFEDYVLDDARHELRRGGEIVPVEARVFELLTYLICNRERVVSQEDLRMEVWDGRIVSISTISSSMNAVRTAIGDNGDDQRFIRTVPRKGFRFVAPVIEEQTDGAPQANLEPASSPTGQVLPVARQQLGASLIAESSSGPSLYPMVTRPGPLRAAGIFATGAAAGVLAATLFFLLWPMQSTPQPRPTKKFDASIVPLVDDDTRRAVASYASRPDHKALAIGSRGQFHVADGAQTIEKAQEAALQGCFEKAKLPCRIYAVGAGVVWSDHTMPLPAPRDVRTESLGMPLDPDTIPLISAAERKTVADRMQAKGVSRALALSTGRYYGHHSSTRREASRIALERCSFMFGRPCLILAVDGFLTIQIPRTRRVTGTLLPSTDAEIPDTHKERIARTYQGREWRALARGETGSWHAIADAPSEAAAIEAALKSCAQADSGCRLYAIGNFRVADE